VLSAKAGKQAEARRVTATIDASGESRTIFVAQWILDGIRGVACWFGDSWVAMMPP
jgi:hypothetical protein